MKRLIFPVQHHPAPAEKPLSPLSAHSLSVLGKLCQAPMPAHEINPGARQRLEREGLIEETFLPSPYAVDKGKKRSHYCITEEGRTKLNDNSTTA